ncbi:hypothetical protein L1987_70671 [Smallanthus sonchifolius]|uniref:Uncharacterized protein n=1 Tax=Smallanthus sonchifolius TaxID=185202 RepID=A0ACB9AQI8_9ASTR|nr:hypothetical protein L1987_70671 [Smallanthus sonchifolius]
MGKTLRPLWCRVGLGDSQTGFERAPQPPSLDSTTNVCDINKEVSLIPSVSVSLDESEQDMGLNQSDASFHAAGISLAGKTGLAGCAGSAGMSDSDSSGSPGVQSLSTGRVNHSGSVTEVGGVGYAAASSNPPVANDGGLSQGVGEITIPPDAVQDGLDMPMQVNDKVQVEYVEEVQLGQEPNVGSEGGDMHMHEHEMLHVSSVHVGLDSSEGVDMHAHEKGLHNVGINGGKKEVEVAKWGGWAGD